MGGVVRDYLLERTGSGRTGGGADLDLVMTGDVMAISRRVADVAGWAFYPLDPTRGLARLVHTAADGAQLVCDISQQRGETLAEDLLGRDFTINAMVFGYVASQGVVSLIDLCGGERDLTERRLRRVTEQSLVDDPLRLLRAVRLAAQFGLTMDPATRAQIPPLAHRITTSSPERMRDELWKALSTSDPAAVVEELRALELLTHLLPEVAATVGVTQSPPHDLDVYGHSLRVVRHAAALSAWLKDDGQRGEETGHSTADQIQWGQIQWGQIQWGMLQPLAGPLRAHFSQGLAAGHTRAEWLVWHALLHDVGKPQTRTVDAPAGGTGDASDAGGAGCIRFLGHEAQSANLAQTRLTELRFSRREANLAAAVAQHHMRPHQLNASFAGKSISRRAIYRFFRGCDGQNASQLTGIDVALLALADYRGKGDEQDEHSNSGEALDAWQEYVAHIGQLLAFAFAPDGWQTVRQQPLINGRVLMQALNLTPGRTVGQILEQLAEAQAAGEIHTADEALQFASTLIAQ